MNAVVSPSSAPTQSFEIRPLDAVLGAEIVGIDLSRPLNDADFARVHRAHLDYGVVVFRDQHLTPEQHIAFSRRFGELQIHVLRQFLLAGHPEIFIISNIIENGQPIGLGDAGKFWHSDLSYKEIPSLGSMLYARELPSEGGDTLFASQQVAYETLPLEVKKALDGKRAAHSYVARYADEVFAGIRRPTLTPEQIAEVKPAIHPVVRTHPETGRKGLFVNENFTTHILDLPEDESRELLRELFAHSAKPEFIYRHQWQDNDLVFWDNRALIHLATGCPSHLRRRMHRTTIQGDIPF
ncbi:MAG TPA: TauD/TfdA family dioxygenase [Pseudomonas sp.]|nr:TauD/TfdA family dioxygenase [Pseudomonas sp.]